MSDEVKDDEEVMGQETTDDDSDNENETESLDVDSDDEDDDEESTHSDEERTPDKNDNDGSTPPEVKRNVVELTNEGKIESVVEPSDDVNVVVESADMGLGTKGESENVEELKNGEAKVESVNGETKVESENGEELKNGVIGTEIAIVVPKEESGVQENSPLAVVAASTTEDYHVNTEGTDNLYPVDQRVWLGDETGTVEEQATFMKELEAFFKERGMDFKPPKFYGEGLNCLKLFRAVTGLGGYDTVTTCKLWRQVGESFKPPKTCTTVSWSFRCFYEKALLDYERHKMRGGELRNVVSHTDPLSPETQMGGNHASGSGRVRRDSASRAMQSWHQRLFGNGEVGDPISKDKNSIPSSKREKQFKSSGLLKRKKPSSLEHASKAARTMAKVPKSQLRFLHTVFLICRVDMNVSDIGPQADWVKINVRRTKDCFEVYALVPGLLREEVRVQSDPAGRLVITGDPEQPDNPWGVTPFKKVVTLPSRIDPHQTSAVVTLHGQLFVRVPFEQSDL
ncbi:hypothetical protein GIB67_033726 [Kingdonia uniflora]|uniref:AT-rich interactive domain-containing protein 3 n=1 Tax=Kingdonia uniflora TaxID=39325 RepID=A0A7J7P4Y9_9MAGN|nr:hypothetical protein GIB67_033726 [Kingdonia uniflora]